jgi:hypothetical protein
MPFIIFEENMGFAVRCSFVKTLSNKDTDSKDLQNVSNTAYISTVSSP